MDLKSFLATTDANNQKQFLDTDIVINTSTTVITTGTVPHSVGDYPDVRVWVRPTLQGLWKPLTDLQTSDFVAGTFEQIRGQCSITKTDVTIALRPTSTIIAQVVRVRVYFND